MLYIIGRQAWFTFSDTKSGTKYSGPILKLLYLFFNRIFPIFPDLNLTFVNWSYLSHK